MKTAKTLGRLVSVITIGAASGFIMAVLFLGLANSLGRNGDSLDGARDVWSSQTILQLGLFYGLFFGIIEFSIGYYLFLRFDGFSLRSFWVTATATLLSGVAGAFFGPPVSAILASVAFFISCIYLFSSRRKNSTAP